MPKPASLRCHVVVAALLLAPLPATAAACPGSTQADLNACAGADYRRADEAMNAAYETLSKQVGPRTRDGLRTAQRAWLAFRDATCDLEALGTEGGSIQPMVRAGCLAQVTRARSATLNGYLACPEGDVSCVGKFGR